jgi:hypothetical protein
MKCLAEKFKFGKKEEKKKKKKKKSQKAWARGFCFGAKVSVSTQAKQREGNRRIRWPEEPLD